MPNFYDADLSIIIVAYNVKGLVEKCLRCIDHSQDTLNKEVIFVDNGSTDGTVEMIKMLFPSVKLILSPTNLGFIKANNLGYEQANGKYILMLNSDAFIKESTLQKFVDFMEDTEECGALGCNAVDAKGNRLPSARYFPTPWRLFVTNMGFAGRFPFTKDINDMKESYDVVRECDWVTGCCLLVRKEIVDTFDYFLRPQLFMYNDDNDLCFRVKQRGWKVYFHPETIIHLAGANNDKIAKEEKDRQRLERLTLESDYVYFRQNYGLHKVLLHFLLLMLFQTCNLVKNCLLFRKAKIQNNLESMQLVYQMLVDTQCGKKECPIHLTK